MSTRVFVTGATGQIGIPLVRACALRGDHVVGLARDGMKFTVSGQLRLDEGVKTWKRRIANPHLYLGSALRMALADRGIALGKKKVSTGPVPLEARPRISRFPLLLPAPSLTLKYAVPPPFELKIAAAVESNATCSKAPASAFSAGVRNASGRRS